MFEYLYDKRFMFKVLAVYTSLAVLSKFTGGIAALMIIPVILWSMAAKKSEWLFASMFFLPLATCTNQLLIKKTAITLGAYRGFLALLGGCMVMTLFGRKRGLFMMPFYGIFAYIAYMFIPSTLGWAPFVSYFKLALFISVFFGFAAIASRVMTDERANIPRLRSVMLAFGIYFFVYSLILLVAAPGMAYMNRDDLTEAELLANLASGGVSLFKGMSQHSQVMGPMAAMGAVLFMGDYIFSVRRHFWLYDMLIAACMICLWKSSSRTAMGTAIIGFAVIGWSLMSARGLSARWKQTVMNLGWGAVLLGLVSVLAVPSLRERVFGFIMKYGGNQVQISQLTIEDVLKSREAKLEGAIANWKQSPTIGNGFQVSEDMKAVHDIRMLVTMPVEKSTWVYANLEEGGVIGSLIFAIWVAATLFALWRRHVHIGLACFIAMLALNMGEYTIFSLSYTGAVIWVMVFAGAVMDSQRYRLEKLNRFIEAEQEAMFLQMLEEGRM